MSNSMKCTSLIRVGSSLIGIAEAVKRLSPSEVLELPPGYYTGSRNCGVNIDKDNVTVRSSMGLGRVIIDCNFRSRHLIIISENVHLDFLYLVPVSYTHLTLPTKRIV